MASGFDLTRSGVGFRFQSQDVDFGSLTNRVVNPEYFADPLNIGASSGAGFIPLGLGDSSVFTSSGFTSVGTASSSMGGMNPYLGALISIGRDVTTAILNRGQGAPAQAPVGVNLGAAWQGYKGVLPGQDPLPPVERPDPPMGVISPTGVGAWPMTKAGKPRRMKKNGMPWKRPSMNPTNPRALGRSMRRVNAFASIAKRTISFTKRVRMKSKKRT